MRYQSHLEPAIKNLSFSIQPGEKIAVVGRTGAGKSSLFQILQGFRQCDEGKCLIDDVDITHISRTNLREGMNVVLQNPYINEADTVKSNLLGISS